MSTAAAIENIDEIEIWRLRGYSTIQDIYFLANIHSYTVYMYIRNTYHTKYNYQKLTDFVCTARWGKFSNAVQHSHSITTHT